MPAPTPRAILQQLRTDEARNIFRLAYEHSIKEFMGFRECARDEGWLICNEADNQFIGCLITTYLSGLYAALQTVHSVRPNDQWVANDMAACDQIGDIMGATDTRINPAEPDQGSPPDSLLD